MEDVKIVCIADIHNNKLSQDEMPEGDILIIAGDATNRGTFSEFKSFRDSLYEWESNFKYIVYVPGKHDIGMHDSYEKYYNYLTEVTNLIVLVNTETMLLGLKIWGSPVSKFDSNWAYTLKEREREHVYKDIPDDIDILVTYSPAEGVLDSVKQRRGVSISMGCIYIRRALEKLHPKLHVCGSSHDSYGAVTGSGTICVNASLVNGEFKPVNKPLVVTLKSDVGETR